MALCSRFTIVGSFLDSRTFFQKDGNFNGKNELSLQTKCSNSGANKTYTMLFNSLDFAIFMPIVFAVYWLLAGNTQRQNLFLLTASYFFYAWWDWRYLSLILLCSITNYVAGRIMLRSQLSAHTNQRIWKLRSATVNRIVVWSACLVSFGILGVFKYCDFFITSFCDAFRLFGADFQPHTLNLILPVGISFYTFHTLSYTIDVYRGKFQPTRDALSFFLFVSIFPLAMAGPIERATNLLPQIYNRRTFNEHNAVDGLRQILWGLFKKVAVADTCAVFVNSVFANPAGCSGSVLLLAAVFFAFQIYGDFSGYSDMAIGIGKLLGFKFLNNFRFPYFSRDIAEFWRRWHISLNTWFRDYLYIPLGGSRVSKAKVIRNTFVIFLVSGFWHGANWTFIAWGAFHACLFLPQILRGTNRKYTDTVAQNTVLPSLKEAFQMLLTFSLVVVGWIFFRAESIEQAFLYIRGICQSSLFSVPARVLELITPLFTIPLMILVEWIQRKQQYGLETFGLRWRKPLRYLFYFVLAFYTVSMLFGNGQTQFIYFQF
jgi:D-alanyl-lipoteichoic acid acyltransferase DltB (MBOAT superfamily)